MWWHPIVRSQAFSWIKPALKPMSAEVGAASRPEVVRDAYGLPRDPRTSWSSQCWPDST